MTRADLAFPFRIAAGSGQAARAAYPNHVDQLIRQVLLTDPGERVNRPTFGAGLRRLLFAPMSSSLSATTTLVVSQALAEWIPDQIQPPPPAAAAGQPVRQVSVVTSDQNASLPDGTILITINYVLVETGQPRQTQVTVS